MKWFNVDTSPNTVYVVRYAHPKCAFGKASFNAICYTTYYFGDFAFENIFKERVK